MNAPTKSLFTMLALAVPLFLVGCDREVSHTGSASVDKDGSTKNKDTTVTQAPDGTVTKQESTKKTDGEGGGSSQTKTTIKSPDGSVTKEKTETTTP